MKWLRRTLILGMMLAGLFQMGCAQTTVCFKDPPGAKLVYRSKTYTFPVTVKLSRPGSIGENSKENIELIIPRDGKILNAEGNICVYGYDERDIDRYSTNYCSISEEQVESMKNGYAVLIEGFSASSQKIYLITIGQKK
jgi:hypothetical protein